MAEGEKKPSSVLLIVGIVAACALAFCAVTGIIAAIAIPNLIKARQGANEAAAIGALRTITTAQALYREGDKDQNGQLDYAADLPSLGRENFVDPVLASGTKQGYLFAIDRADAKGFRATARPVEPGRSGSRSFFVDESGEVRWARDRPATAQDPPIGR